MSQDSALPLSYVRTAPSPIGEQNFGPIRSFTELRGRTARRNCHAGVTIRAAIIAVIMHQMWTTGEEFRWSNKGSDTEFAA